MTTKEVSTAITAIYSIGCATKRPRTLRVAAAGSSVQPTHPCIPSPHHSVTIPTAP